MSNLKSVGISSFFGLQSFYITAQFLLLIALFVLLGANYGQVQAQPKVDKAAIQVAHPDEDAVMLNKEEHLGIVYENGAWDIERTVSEEFFYLENAAKVYAQKMIYYTSFEDIVNIEAKTYVPYQKGKKTRYEVVPVRNLSLIHI